MTRIGFAYNQKPDSTEFISDEFADWDSSETIDAVARALSALGEVVRLEADENFPENLRRENPDIVFNIAEGRSGVNRDFFFRPCDRRFLPLLLDPTRGRSRSRRRIRELQQRGS